MTSSQALLRLQEGNRRFVLGRATRAGIDTKRRLAVAHGQEPWAAILSCADSRVVPSIIFDQGLGDLFEVSIAGNVAGDSAIASLELAVARLGVPLIVVLGHDQCGAVQAALGGESAGRLETLMELLKPAIDEARHMTGDVMDNAVRANALLVARQLRDTEPILASAVRREQLCILAAYYKLGSGEVTFLESSVAG